MCERKDECYLGDECQQEGICLVELEVWDGAITIVKDPRTHCIGEGSTIGAAVNNLFQSYREAGRSDWIPEKECLTLLTGENVKIEELLSISLN